MRHPGPGVHVHVVAVDGRRVLVDERDRTVRCQILRQDEVRVVVGHFVLDVPARVVVDAVVQDEP